MHQQNHLKFRTIFCCLICVVVLLMVLQKCLWMPVNIFNKKSNYRSILPKFAGYRPIHHNINTYSDKKEYGNYSRIVPTLTLSALHQNESILNRTDVNRAINKTQHITDPKHCTFSIENQRKSYNICDKIHVIIQARDQFNTNKQIGGDYFRAKMFTTTLKASAPTDGEVVDHNNGSYSAYFTLRWSGFVSIHVQLVHSSEAIAAMQRVRETNPIRMAYTGIFQLKKTKSTVLCHVQLSTANELCNYTDKMTGEPWFCIKPKNLPCSAYYGHVGNLRLANKLTAAMFTPTEKLLFSNIKRSIGSKEILVNASDKNTICIESKTECRPVQNSAKPIKKIAAGFYFDDKWYSNECTLKNISVQIALTSEMLTNKRFFFYGDSTLRQWFEYFAATTNTSITPAAPGATSQTGPLSAKSDKYNLTFFYRHHAFPIRTKTMLVKNAAYAANEIDNITADENTVICLCFFAHFTPTDLDVYRSRLKTAKASLLRLYKRSPKTLVFLKTPNTLAYGDYITAVNMGDWVSLLLDKELRKVMAGIPNLTIIDVWDMTTNHRLGENLHPPRPIIQQEIQLMLSLIFA